MLGNLTDSADSISIAVRSRHESFGWFWVQAGYKTFVLYVVISAIGVDVGRDYAHELRGVSNELFGKFHSLHGRVWVTFT